jgi:hypothetical protein
MQIYENQNLEAKSLTARDKRKLSRLKKKAEKDDESSIQQPKLVESKNALRIESMTPLFIDLDEIGNIDELVK